MGDMFTVSKERGDEEAQEEDEEEEEDEEDEEDKEGGEEDDGGDEDGDDDDDDDDGERRPMGGFMFGNVDDAGDLDEEYFDQDAKEHLSALVHQLGPSLVDIELSGKQKRQGIGVSSTEEQEDYRRKAENAVDYEDIQEEYEGPEVQLGPQDMQIYAQAALVGQPKLPDEDNYDDDDDDEFDSAEQPAEAASSLDTDDLGVAAVVVDEGHRAGPTASDEEVDEKEDLEGVELSKEVVPSPKVLESEARIELPVLCEEDGKTVLRFSELFGVQEPYWVVGHRRGRQKREPIKEKPERVEVDEDGLEEDEETAFKVASQHPGRVWNNVRSETQEIGGDSIATEQDGCALEDESVPRPHEDWLSKHKKSLVPAEPMKREMDLWAADIANWKRQFPSSNFDHLHQQEWETNILWGPVDVTETCRIFNDGQHKNNLAPHKQLDSKSSSKSVQEKTSGTTGLEVISIAEMDVNMQLDSHWLRPFSVECIGQPTVSGAEHIELQKKSRHPQMLRLESQCFASDEEYQEGTDILSHIGSLTLEAKEKNAELTAGDWFDHVLWGNGKYYPSSSPWRPKVIFDLTDRQMVFEISDTKEGHALRLHAAAVVLAPPEKESSLEGGDVSNNAAVSSTRFNISNDKFYTNKKTHQQQKSNAKKRAVHGIKVMHSLPAIKLQTMKPKLSNKDLANFHRPKAIWYPHHNEVAAKEQGRLAAKGPMNIILKTLGGKGSKLHVDASETLQILKVKVAKKLGDLKASEKTKVFYSGKELVEGCTFSQQQVPPNSVLHLVRTKVHPWPKAQRLPGEHKPIRPPGAFKKKSELSVKDGHVALMEYCEERPLLLGNVGMGARLSTYYRKLLPTDATAATLRNERGSWVGVPLPLEPTEDSPFLGEIRPGDTQSSLETNMYRAPVFAHKVATTDFLLVRSAKGKLTLRRIDSIHVVGQQEPHMEVLTPTSKMVQNYIGNRLLTYLYREFRVNEKPGSSPPRLLADELLSQFPSLTEGFMRKRIKHCADLQRVNGEMCWVMRPNFRIPSEEELRRMVTPENVCTYESMQAGLHHLKRMGVQKLTQPTGLSAAMNQLPDEAIALAAASHIERELQITPWNLSSNFVSATMQGRGSLERLEIVGPGDPSGRGLGFSYLRVATRPTNAGALVEKKAAAARGGGAVTGTDADLRRLSMEAAREVLLKFKVSEEEIEKMTRWHRIALVRKLSSEQAASGVRLGAAALNKFARGQRMSFLQLQQQTREKCQDIWDKQVQSLSLPEGDNTDSDGEANGDLDSFAGDLENLLEAEEGDEGGGKKGRREGIRGLGARRRLLQAQLEEDIEDEEAEAAELRRMLMEDDEAEEEQRNKMGGTSSKGNESLSKDLPGDEAGQPLGGKKKRRILKRIIRTRKPDGTYTSKEIIITDPKEVASYLAKKNAAKMAGQKGVDKEGSAKKGSRKPSLNASKKAEKGAPLKDTKSSKLAGKAKVNGKFGRDALTLVCGACGQLGHMRTNKKCPLYMEEGEPVAWQDSGAAAEGLLERQGTKITIRKNRKPTQKMDEQQSFEDKEFLPPTSVTGSRKEQKLNPPLPAKLPPPPPAKLPSLKIKIGNINQTAEENSMPPLKKSIAPKSGNINLRDLNGVGDSRGSKTKLGPLKLKVSGRHQKDLQLTWGRGNIEMEDEKRVRERREYELALLEEREREEKEMERKVTLSNANAVEGTGVKKIRKVMLNIAKKNKNLHMVKEGEEMKWKQEQEPKEKIMKRERKRETHRSLEALEETRQEVEVEMNQRTTESDRREAERHYPNDIKVRLKPERIQHRKEVKPQRRERDIERERAREREEAKALDIEREKVREREEQMKEEEEQRRENLHRKRGKLKQQKLISAIPEKEMGKGVKRHPNTEISRGMLHAPELTNTAKRPRKRGGEVELSNILEIVVEILRNSDVSYLFRKPVPKKDAPDYLQYVKRPMDLSTIREKIRKLRYKHRDEFKRDVQQITDNAHIYNDYRNPGIPPLADKLLEICDDELNLRDIELAEAESAVERFDEITYSSSKGVSPPVNHMRRSR